MKRKYLTILVLLMVIGFASITTTLYINGSLSFGFNDEDYVIKFTKAVIDGEIVSDTAISGDGQKITFSTSDLSLAGDKSILNFDITNSSTQYDASVSMDCEVKNAKYSNLYAISYSVPEFIEAKTIKSGYIEVSLNESVITSATEEFECTITANAEGRDSIVNDFVETIPELTAHDTEILKEVTYKGDYFYIIGSDSEKITLLSKFPINNKSPYRQFNPVPSWMEYKYKFAENYYWDDACNGKYPCDLNSIPIDEENSVMYAAREYGKNIGGTGRLLTSAEVSLLRTKNSSLLFGENFKTNDNWLVYWTGIAYNINCVYILNGNGDLYTPYYILDSTSHVGIRPVIDILRSNV